MDATAARSARAELDRERGVLTITLSRPRQRNPLDEQVFAVLAQAFTSTVHDPVVRVVVLRGEGPSFCSGLDRGILAGIGGDGPDAIRAKGAELQAIIDAIEASPRPTLAVVQGACVGGGMALLLACDLRVAAEDAHFSLMEMRYGFLPDLGHIHRLQREVGLSRAKRLVYLAEDVGAATLEAWGVLAEVVPGDRLEATAEAWISRLAAAPPLAVAAAKTLMQADPGGSGGAAAQRGALEANAASLLRSADFGEGLAAALERRSPRFRGA